MLRADPFRSWLLPLTIHVLLLVLFGRVMTLDLVSPLPPFARSQHFEIQPFKPCFFRRVGAPERLINVEKCTCSMH